MTADDCASASKAVAQMRNWSYPAYDRFLKYIKRGELDRGMGSAIFPRGFLHKICRDIRALGHAVSSTIFFPTGKAIQVSPIYFLHSTEGMAWSRQREAEHHAEH